MVCDKIDDLNNSCTLKAVREVTRLDDETILNAFEKHGYIKGKGMPHAKWTAAAQDLGLQLEEVFAKDYYSCSLAEFLRNHATGNYFVSVTGHALVVRNGRIMDSIQHYLGLRRRVRYAKRILNAPAIPAKEIKGILKVKIPAWRAKNRSSASFQRYYEMEAYLLKNPKASIDEIYKSTAYTKADYNHDLKKGLIEIC